MQKSMTVRDGGEQGRDRPKRDQISNHTHVKHLPSQKKQTDLLQFLQSGLTQ